MQKISAGNYKLTNKHSSGNSKLEQIKFQASAYFLKFIDKWAPRSGSSS